MHNIPRLRARVGTATEPEELKGKFFFEVFLAAPGEGNGQKLGDWGPYDTEKEAHIEMRKTVREMSELIQKEITGKASGRYLDMKTNEFHNWEQH